MNNNFSIQDESDFNNGVPSLKEIALMHIRKISDICCNEFTLGYWEEKPVKVGGGIAMMRTYHPDQRAAFCNAVDFLLWLIYPMADKTFKDKYKLEEEKSDDEKNKNNKDDKEEIKKEKVDWVKRVEERKRIFIDINLMFERKNFFDTMSGHTKTGKV